MHTRINVSERLELPARAPCAPLPGRAPAGSAPVRVTILDLDRTLTRRGTYTPFLLRSAWRHAPHRLLLVPAVLACMIAYRLKRIDRKSLKQWMFRMMLGPTLSPVTAESLVADFADRVVRNGLHAEALPLIERERGEGRRLILATAAHRFYAEAIARRLGIADVVATESQWVDGRLTSVIAGGNCYGEGKIAAIRDRLAALGLARADVDLRVYSDDISDLPCFDEADSRFVVNPSRRLARLAEARAWSVLRFR